MANKGFQDRVMGRAPAPDALSGALREAREARSMTRREVACALGLSQHTIYLWETAGCAPAVERLEAVAELLALDVARLLELVASAKTARAAG